MEGGNKVLKAAPKSREVYWISAPDGAKVPEFTGSHPGIIVRGAHGLNEFRDTVVFVPITSKEPPKNADGEYGPYAYKLSQNPNPNDDRPVWAITEQLLTTRLSRMTPFKTVMGSAVPRVSRDDFNMIMDHIFCSNGAFMMHVDRIVQNEISNVTSEYEEKIAQLQARELELESRIRRMELRAERKALMASNLQERVESAKEHNSRVSIPGL